MELTMYSTCLGIKSLSSSPTHYIFACYMNYFLEYHELVDVHYVEVVWLLISYSGKISSS
jgi:hypothetical protein